MKHPILLALALSVAPVAALAMPVLGDVVGTNPTDATAALEKAGCKVTAFEAEGGKIEAKCVETASNKSWEVYIDPKTGAVVDMKYYD
ncbi:MAG: PepSY domain-containing protein [Paracoccaceae bacterium]